MPRPSPNGMSTPTIELRSLALAPRTPMRIAATRAPPREPSTTLPPNSRSRKPTTGGIIAARATAREE